MNRARETYETNSLHSEFHLFLSHACKDINKIISYFSASIMIPSGDSSSVSPICVLSTTEMMTRLVVRLKNTALMMMMRLKYCFVILFNY